MKPRLTLALIYGSARDGRFCDTVADWPLRHLPDMIEADILTVDPAHLNAGSSMARTEVERRIGRDLARADGFLVVTPEYNHGYPAALKELIDCYQKPWSAKPVAFVSYGGVSGGLRAVEQLRQVFAEVGAATTRETVSFANAWEQFDAEGNPRAPEDVLRRLRALVVQLDWWMTTLKHGRDTVVFREVA